MLSPVPDRICEASAHECVRLAQATDDPELKKNLLQMAHDWMVAAMTSNQEQLGGVPEDVDV